jgi:hypothetical protein
MSLSIRNEMNGALLEKVILGNDLSGLSPIDKVQYVKNVCQTLGLNPVTKPIQLIKFQGQEKPYFTKDATEQLRKINNISITKIDTKILEGGLYIVTVNGRTPDGREDSSTGAIVVSGLKGEMLANAMMKAETKAKRRFTLSICGLGFIDESEAESIPHARKVDIQPSPMNVQLEVDNIEILDNTLLNISQSGNVDELQEVFTIAYKHFTSLRDKESLKKVIDAKDKKKAELEMVKEFNEEIDSATGEVK